MDDIRRATPVLATSLRALLLTLGYRVVCVPMRGFAAAAGDHAVPAAPDHSP